MDYHHFIGQHALETEDLADIEARLALVQRDLQEMGDSITQRKPIHIRKAVLGAIFGLGGILGALKTCEHGENPNTMLHISSGIIAVVSTLGGVYHGIRSVQPQTLDDTTRISILQEERIYLLEASSALRERSMS